MIVGSKDNLVRFSFCQVFEPKAMDEKSEPKYSVQVIIPKTDTVTIAAVEKAIDSAKKDGIKRALFNSAKAAAPEFKICLRDGDQAAAEKDDGSRDYLKGMMFFNANANKDSKPGLVDRYNQQIINQDDFYAGCYGLVDVGIYPYSFGKGGIAAGLNNIMKWEDGERLDGRLSATAAFANHADDQYGGTDGELT